MELEHPKSFFDEKHALMQLEYVRAKEQQGYDLFGIEVPYGQGRGGFIDVVLYKRNEKAKSATWLIAELKPSIHNFGEMIRQVKRAQQLFFVSNRALLDPDYENIVKFPLVIWADKENLRRCVKFLKLLTGVELDFFHTNREMLVEISNEYEVEAAIDMVKSMSA